METTIIQSVGKLLFEKKLTIAFAESATAGRLSAEFSMPKNAGKFLKGAIVCYDACLKEDILMVDKKLIEEYTPESAEVTHAIAEGLKNVIKADIYVGVTGLPTDGGSETQEKPIGTMFIHALMNGKTLFEDRKVYAGSPSAIIMQTINRVGELLLKHLQ